MPTAGSPNRYTHRKRISAQSIASTLPEYIPTGGWPQTKSDTGKPEIKVHGVKPRLDLLPDYAQVVGDEDADTDVDGNTGLHNFNSRHRQLRRQLQHDHVPQPTMSGGPHYHRYSRTSLEPKFRRYLSHRKAKSVDSAALLKSLPPLPGAQSSRPSLPLPSSSSSDLFLDSLLERSIHALEMSNALLQSSMNTRSSLSTFISEAAGSGLILQSEREPFVITNRESRSYGDALSDERYEAFVSRIQTWRNIGETWADDLGQIERGVELLLGEGDVGAPEDDANVEVGQGVQISRATGESEWMAQRSGCSISSSTSMESLTIIKDQWEERRPSAKRTILELRRILYGQPSPQSQTGLEFTSKPPALLQKVGGTGTMVEASTSNATASVSRLLTKNKHSTFTSPPSPTKQSLSNLRSISDIPTTRVTLSTSSANEITAKSIPHSSLGSNNSFRMPQAFTWLVTSTAKEKGKAKENLEAERPEAYGSSDSLKTGTSAQSTDGSQRRTSDSEESKDGGWLEWLIGVGTPTSMHDRMEDQSDGLWGNGSARLIAGGVYSGLNDWAV